MGRRARRRERRPGQREADEQTRTDGQHDEQCQTDAPGTDGKVGAHQVHAPVEEMRTGHQHHAGAYDDEPIGHGQAKPRRQATDHGGEDRGDERLQERVVVGARHDASQQRPACRARRDQPDREPIRCAEDDAEGCRARSRHRHEAEQGDGVASPDVLEPSQPVVDPDLAGTNRLHDSLRRRDSADIDPDRCHFPEQRPVLRLQHVFAPAGGERHRPPLSPCQPLDRETRPFRGLPVGKEKGGGLHQEHRQTIVHALRTATPAVLLKPRGTARPRHRTSRDLNPARHDRCSRRRAGLGTQASQRQRGVFRREAMPSNASSDV